MGMTKERFLAALANPWTPSELRTLGEQYKRITAVSGHNHLLGDLARAIHRFIPGRSPGAIEKQLQINGYWTPLRRKRKRRGVRRSRRPAVSRVAGRPAGKVTHHKSFTCPSCGVTSDVV